MKRNPKNLIFYVFVLTTICFFIFPLYWMITMSFKTRLQITNPATFIFDPTLRNYEQLFGFLQIQKYLGNSLVISISSISVSLVLAIPAAYGLSRTMGKRGEDISFWFLSLRLLPGIFTLIPYFIIARTLGIFDTYWILILTYMTFNVPFAVWVLKGFFDALPTDFEEAAMVDGCSRFQAFLRISLPLLATGIAATAILCFIQSWNELVFALFLTSTKSRTITTSIITFFTYAGVKWGELAGAAVIASLPPVMLVWFVQKYFAKSYIR